jgi:hypothetical protein
MHSCLLHSVFGRWWRLGALLVIAAVFPATQAWSVDGDVAERVQQCFEGPAAKAAAEAKGSDDLSRKMAEMAAGKQCEKAAAQIIQACLAKIDAAEDDSGAKDYYPCIGIIANPCIDSQWASNEFRLVVCADTEEKAWLDIVNETLDKLRAKLKEERKERLEAASKNFFAFRNEKCGLVRMLREKIQPDIAYGACTTETTARFAIDLRDMLETVEHPEKITAIADSFKEPEGKQQPANKASVPSRK